MTKHKLFTSLLLFVCFNHTIALAQSFNRTYTETFATGDVPKISLNTTNTDIKFESWHKNTIEVTADVTINGVTKGEADKYFDDLPISILGNSHGVQVSTKRPAFDWNFDNSFLHTFDIATPSKRVVINGLDGLDNDDVLFFDAEHFMDSFDIDVLDPHDIQVELKNIRYLGEKLKGPFIFRFDADEDFDFDFDTSAIHELKEWAEEQKEWALELRNEHSQLNEEMKNEIEREVEELRRRLNDSIKVEIYDLTDEELRKERNIIRYKAIEERNEAKREAIIQRERAREESEMEKRELMKERERTAEEREEFKKEYKELKEEEKRLRKEESKKIIEEIKAERAKIIKETKALHGTKTKVVMIDPDHTESVVTYFSNSSIENDFDVVKTITVKVPANVEIEMDVRHGTIDLPTKLEHINAQLSYSTLNAPQIKGSQSNLIVQNTEINVKDWHSGSLKSVFSSPINIDHVKKIKITNESSDINIKSLNGTIEGRSNLGNISIDKLESGFSTLDLRLVNTDLECKLPRAGCRLDLKGSYTDIDLPESLDLEQSGDKKNKVIKGFYKSNSADSNISVNALYGNVRLQIP